MKNEEQKLAKLYQRQVKALNHIKDYIVMANDEIIEGYYSNDKHSEYWKMFKDFAERIRKDLKGIENEEYCYIPKWREEELLVKEEKLEKLEEKTKELEYQNEILELLVPVDKRIWIPYEDDKGDE